jgi:UDP-N-acetylglucosamine 4,6-dehydratase
VKDVFSSRCLLITGGTGSFGNAVLRKHLDSSVREIRIFSRDEKKQHDMRQQYGSDKVKYVVGDVRDFDSIDAAMEGVDLVFHAAALKQVPSCEFYPMEAVKTNILGAQNVLEAAIRHQVQRVIVLSTDKAVYPINAMGMSKALMEKTMVARSRTIPGDKTVLCGTRYGNVMASRGSVIPLFLEQITSGKPVTVTDPRMTRFLLHLDEAVDLVVHAFRHALQGDIFVRKAPACTMGDLATAMRELLGAANPTEEIGTRHGEKLYETLVNREEMARAEEGGDYFRIPPDTRDLNYGKFFWNGERAITECDDYTSHNTRRLAVEQIKEVLLTLDEVRQAVEPDSGRQP